MAVFNSLMFFGVFWVSLVYADGAMQLAFSITGVVGLFVNGLYGVYMGR